MTMRQLMKQRLESVSSQLADELVERQRRLREIEQLKEERDAALEERDHWRMTARAALELVKEYREDAA